VTYLSPFVLTVPATAPETARHRHDRVDLYLPGPDTPRPHPAVAFVHGGPVPAAVRPTPRDWPLYVGYAKAAAARGVVAVTVDHRLHTPADYPRAAADAGDLPIVLTSAAKHRRTPPPSPRSSTPPEPTRRGWTSSTCPTGSTASTSTTTPTNPAAPSKRHSTPSPHSLVDNVHYVK
jgi:hypothetical protein